jgi:hypothetical protein
VLETNVSTIVLEASGSNATITTIAIATLTNSSDGRPIFTKSYRYSVKDSMGDWNKNDKALLRDYGIGAGQYIARRISDEFFGQVKLRHVLRQVRTSTKGTLQWELILLGENKASAWANAFSENDARYDLEIYDSSQLAFSAHDIADTSYPIPDSLEPCKSYYWTVRPIYSFEETARAGEWMAHESAIRRMYSSVSSSAKELTIREITEGYPEFKTRC